MTQEDLRHLSEEERQTLMSLIDQGKGPAGKRKRAHMLLLADEAQENGGGKDADIVKALHTSRRTVERVREKCVLQGIEAAINHSRPRKTRSKVLDGEAEARLVHLACSPAPEGYERWTLQLLADKLIELEIVETVSGETVRTTLKKMNLSLG